jgi:hypothetical protein
MRFRLELYGWCTVAGLAFLSVGLVPRGGAWAQVGTCDQGQFATVLNANNVAATLQATGFITGSGGASYYEVPAGMGSQSMGGTQLFVGGIVNGEVRFAGNRSQSSFHSEYWPGPIDDDGLPPQDCSEYDRIWTVTPADVRAYEEGGATTQDLADWPTGLGAPTVDASGLEVDLALLPLSERRDRVIDLAAGERPRILGSQMSWWVLNDNGNEHRSPASEPLGIEVHVSAFALGNNTALENSTFFQLRIINRSTSTIEQTYIGYHTYARIDFWSPLYLAADTTRDMAIIYSETNDIGADGPYWPGPPASGIDFVAGPYLEGGTPFRMTSLVQYFDSPGLPNDSPRTPEDYYNFMQGTWTDGAPIVAGRTGHESPGDLAYEPTTIMYPGDPVTGAFWSEQNVDGQGTANNGSERFFVAAGGPFNLPAGESVDLLIAVLYARGTDNIDSVRKLRRVHDITARLSVDGFVLSGEQMPIESTFPLEWSHVFPSPGTLGQKLEYSLSAESHISIEVYNTLGQRIATPTKSIMPAGLHSLSLDSETWAAGVYFVTIRLGGRGAQTQKFVIR